MGDLYVGVDCGSFHLKSWHRAVRDVLFLADSQSRHSG